MATHHPIRKTVTAPAPVIPDKLYFRIGDVARLCEVPAYVLRFWETEFPNLKPNKGGTGQRLYRRKDVETALRIKHLLYDLGYTIPGARQVFKTDAKVDAQPAEIAGTAAATPREDAVIPNTAPSAQSSAPDTNPVAGAISSPALQTLREELRALHAQLSAPLAVESPATPEPLRPRLVAESKPKLRLEPKPIPKLGPVPLFDQQDLFSAE
jgi:DNA-binding transcriptional MerR regulator